MSGGGIAGILMIFLLVIVLFIAASCVKIVPQASAYVVESLGKYKGTWATGLHFKVPFIERVAIRVNLKEQVVDFPPQPVITKRSRLPMSSSMQFWRPERMRQPAWENSRR